jgi:hypothetical protein
VRSKSGLPFLEQSALGSRQMRTFSIVFEGEEKLLSIRRPNRGGATWGSYHERWMRGFRNVKSKETPLQVEAKRHHHSCMPGILKRKLRAAGYQPVRSTYFNAIFFLPIAAFRFTVRICRARREKPKAAFTCSFWLLNDILVSVCSAEAWLLKCVSLSSGLSAFAAANPSSCGKK